MAPGVPQAPSAATGTRAETPRASTANLGPLTLGQEFGSRYRILKALGAGGMGAVYQAWDEELGVAVALKVIRPEALADPQAAQEVERRFKRELLLARQVTHRNVVRIHDLGEVGGIKYLTMPYVQGEDLADVLKREGRLPVDRTLAIAKQVASGLAAAHEKGVVHRDLKPENIMIDADGTAIIMDFGIARSVSGTGTATKLGAVMGTLEYMAPEQAQGQPADHRADIYAFGLILYDLIGGRWRASQHENPMSELMARLTQPLPPIKVVAPEATPALDAVIAKCLEVNPADRYQTTAELLQVLENLDAHGHPIRKVARFRAPASRWDYAAIGLAIVALAALGGTWWLWRNRAGPEPPARESVTVLIADFQNGAKDPVFEGTLEQTLSLAMEGAAFITSYPRREALAVAGQLQPGSTRIDENLARLISQREAIKVVLAGSIETSGRGYDVRVRAIDPIPGTELARAEASADDKSEVLEAVATVAGRIREALGDTTIESAELVARETFSAASLDAARAYSMAQALANGDKHEAAIEQYQRAVQLDPNMGRAYSGWALSAGRLGRREEEAELYKKALALLDRMTEREKYRTLGVYYLRAVGNYEKAIENFSILVQKYPADSAAHNNLAVSYFNTLNFEKAREEGARLVAIYPKSVLYRYNNALYAMYGGEFDTAEREAREAIALNPQTPLAYLALAAAARLSRGDAAAARATYVQAREKAGVRGTSLAAMGLADLAMYEGRFADAQPLLEAGAAEDLARKNLAGAAAKRIALAEARAALGQVPQALADAGDALKLRQTAAVVVPAARILIDARKDVEARTLAGELGKQIQPISRAYGKLVEGQIALARGRAADAVQAFLAAQKLADLWLVRFNLGVAYLAAGHHAEALSEFEACDKRRGEATAVFLDDVPSFRYLAPLPYWLARAQEGLGLKAPAVENYKKFLALRPEGSKDPLAADARKRAGG